MITCPSTQPQASGTVQVSSRSAVLPPKSGRNTRTALKAAKPLTPRNSPTHSSSVQPPPVPTHPEQLREPPTHPGVEVIRVPPCSEQLGDPHTHPGIDVTRVPPHPEQLQVPPTHPILSPGNIHPCRSQTLPLAIQGIPTISQLRDYPNLSKRPHPQPRWRNIHPWPPPKAQLL